ncbi:MAG: ferredoxin reductase family protein [Gammaproteobacteria bacterium]|nr:ferredoxin reductase family protein [Gammaproteobacteria bacterium]
MPPLVLLVVYVAVALTPMTLAYLQDLPPRSFRDDLSSGLAMTGFAMLLVQFVLIGRFKAVSAGTGIDVTMRFHQLIARSLTVFLLLHPFIYASPMNAPLPWDPTRQLTLELTGAATITGMLGWLALAVLMATAIFRDELGIRYEAWRLTHGLGAALIALLGLHHTLAIGRYSAAPEMTWMWVALVAIALASLLYVYVVTPLLQLRSPYRVVAVNELALKTWELIIEPSKGEAIDFAPGQFVWLTLGRSPFAITEHPFSISSAPAERPRIAFVIKEVGDGTRELARVAPGARAYVDGPHGNLTLGDRAGEGIVFIAGGVGIAPILSMLRELRARGDERAVKLVYGNRIPEQIVYRRELEDLGSRANVEIHHVLGEPPADWQGTVGQLDLATLEPLLRFPGYERWLYVVCGPGAMIDSVESSLERLGVPLRRILSEKFNYD